MARGKSWLGRLARVLLGIVLLFGLLSAGMVLLFRWVNPPFSAFMPRCRSRPGRVGTHRTCPGTPGRI